MARLFVAASTQGLSMPSNIGVGNVPLTVSMWIKLSSMTANMLCFILNSVTDTGNYINLNAGGQLQAVTTGTTGVQTSVVTTNTWYHLCATFITSSSRAIFLNGAKSTDTQNATVADFTRSSIGCYFNGSINNAWDGIIAEVAVWNTVLTDDQIGSLYKAFSAQMINPQSLQFYAPLVNGLADLRAGASIVDAGPTTVTVDQPRIYY